MSNIIIGQKRKQANNQTNKKQKQNKTKPKKKQQQQNNSQLLKGIALKLYISVHLKKKFSFCAAEKKCLVLRVFGPRPKFIRSSACAVLPHILFVFMLILFVDFDGK